MSTSNLRENELCLAYTLTATFILRQQRWPEKGRRLGAANEVYETVNSAAILSEIAYNFNHLDR